jgi:ankyrin repeat protein
VCRLSGAVADDDVVFVLVERTISVAGGERALLTAAKAGREDLVELLAGFKADLDARYGFNRTALHLMAEEGKVDMVQVLLKLGADTEAKDQVSLKRETLTHA